MFIPDDSVIALDSKAGVPGPSCVDVQKINVQQGISCHVHFFSAVLRVEFEVQTDMEAEEL